MRPLLFVLGWVLFVLGFMSYQAFFATNRPADLRIELGAPEQNGPLAQIPVTLSNVGDRVATRVTIEVCDAPSTCATLEFDYVPFRSTRTGMIQLPRPLTLPLKARVVSYLDP